MSRINISIRNSNREGSCGIKSGNITIWVHNLTNPDKNFNFFLCHFIAVEFHEIGHRYDELDHCSGFWVGVADRLANELYEQMISA